MDGDRSGIATLEDRERIAYEGLTLHAVRDGAALLTSLSVCIPRGMRVLVTGPNEAARAALFRATAGIGSRGTGRIARPSLDAIFFVPQQPYLVPGTLRQLLAVAEQEQERSDEHILAAMSEGGLDSVVQHAGGLDVEHDWPAMLSLGELQALAIVRVLLARPPFAVLDRASTALGSARLAQYLERLTGNSITYINFDDAEHLSELYDAVLEIDNSGAWNWRTLRSGVV